MESGRFPHKRRRERDVFFGTNVGGRKAYLVGKYFLFSVFKLFENKENVFSYENKTKTKKMNSLFSTFYI